MKRKTAKQLLLIIAIIVVSPMFLATASAHRSGCHRWHSCPSDSGSYVCGDTGYSSGCGTSTYTEPAQVYQAPAPHVPVISTKIVSEDEAIPFSHIQKMTNREYSGYTKINTEGVTGVKRVNTEITYSDGVETSRKTAGDTIVSPPLDEVTMVGNRMNPSANLIAIGATKKKDKFDIKGHSLSNSVVVLSVDGKRIKRAYTDSKGMFIFKNIKLANKSAKIIIYNRIQGKETVISEPYTLTLAKRTFVSDYDMQHIMR